MTAPSAIGLRGQQVAYRLEGRKGAPVVLLVHGILTDHRAWDAVAADLGADFAVLRYDVRGHGGSTAPPAPYTMEQLAADVPELLDALRIDRVHFVGSSLGGMIGQQVGARHGHRLLTLTLANTGAAQAAAAAWQERIDVARERGVAALAEPTMQRWFTEAWRQAHAAEVQRMTDLLLGTSVEGYVGCAAAVRDLAQLDLLPRIAVPTLVVAGTEDTAMPPAATAKIAQLVPGARLVSLPTGHQGAVEQPQAFCTAWREFVAAHT
ncbi:3-oxoadipate enol-lactonase [Ramlibacter sp. PS3R-8]|uniref:3-oxoadipate enol-lactonase n=1 Tax=Ramlibacter sp. PS3R-8 TaxID=3133437 RepID=UPI0030AC7A55